LARASATIVLNSVDDGRPVALLEGAVISARRTAASAAVAAAELTAGAPHEVRTGVSLIGCGVINGEVLRFLRTQLPELAHVSVFDLDPRRARAFADRIRQGGPPLRVEVVETVEQAIAANRLVSLATTATRPHLDLQDCRPGTVLLHLSLRDLTPASVLSARNVVDDAEHVCRAETSLDLAERAVGDRRFITAEIGNVLAGRTQVAWDPASVTVFSPFGLGALDAALAAYVHDVAAARGFGIHITDFVPAEGRSAPY
jgi:ornithine cyclodeaminase